ncbi:MAG: hypothetical protein ABIH86_00020 [Planctomycetota bacterium]
MACFAFAFLPVANGCLGCFIAFALFVALALIINHYSEKNRRLKLTQFAVTRQCRFVLEIQNTTQPSVINEISEEMSDFEYLQPYSFTKFNNFITGPIDHNDIMFFDFNATVSSSGSSQIKLSTLILVSNDGLDLPPFGIEPIDVEANKTAVVSIDSFRSLFSVQGNPPERLLNAFIERVLPLLRLDPTLRIETNQDRFVVIGNAQISNDKVIAFIEKSVLLGTDLAESGLFE